MLGLGPMATGEESGGGGLSRAWLWRLIVGRVLVAGVLLGASALWASAAGPSAGEPSRFEGSLPLAGAVLGLTVLYALALRFSRLPLRLQAAVQFAFDVLLITRLAWVTGNVYSPYSALYIVVISVVSIYLGARGALLASVGCATLYTAAMLSLAAGLGVAQPREVSFASMAEAASAIGLNDVAFLVVGLLAARLAERQTRSES